MDWIHKIVGDPSTASARARFAWPDWLVRGPSSEEVGRRLEQDVGLAVRLVHVTNTFQNNPGGIPIGDARQAVALLGLEESVSTLLALHVQEWVERELDAAALRELMASALLSGLLAGVIVREHSTLGWTSVQAHTLLESLGLGLGAMLGFAQWPHGLDPVGLARRMRAGSVFSQPISRALEECESSGDRPGIPEAWVALPTVARLIVSNLVAPEIPTHLFLRDTRDRLREIPMLTGIQRNQVTRCFWLVEERCDALAADFGRMLYSTLTLKRFKNRTSLLDPGPAASLTGLTTTPFPFHTPEKSRPAQSQHPDLLLECIRDLSRVLGNPPVSMEAAQQCIARRIRSALDLDAFLIWERTDPGSGLRCVHTSGISLPAGFAIPDLVAGKRDVFSLALHRGEDIFIADGADPRTAPYVPDWLRAGGVPHASFLLLPVHENGDPFALFFGSRHQAVPFTLTVRDLQHLKAIRLQMATARRIRAFH